MSCDCYNHYLVAIDISCSVLQLLDKTKTSPLMSLLLLWRHWLCYCSGYCSAHLTSFCIFVHSGHTSCNSYNKHWTYWSISCLSPSDLESCESDLNDLSVISRILDLTLIGMGLLNMMFILMFYFYI